MLDDANRHWMVQTLTSDFSRATNIAYQGINMLSKKSLFLCIFPIFMAYVLQLRWTELDNQTFDAIHPGGTYGGLFIPPAVALAILLVFISARISDVAKMSGHIPVIVPLGVAIYALSALWSIDPLRSLIVAVDLFSVACIAALGVAYLGERRLLGAIAGFTLVILFVSIVLSAIGDPHSLNSGWNDGAWRGLFMHKNLFSRIIVTFTMIVLLSGNRLGFSRQAKVFALAISAIGLIGSQSASALVVMLTVLCLVKISEFSFQSPATRLLLYVFFFLIGLPVFIFLTDSLESMASFLGRDLTLSGRTQLWQAALPFIFDAPFGYGAGTSGGISVFQAMRATGWTAVASTHNSYIATALDVGWLFAGIVVVWLVYNVVSSKNSPLLIGLSGIQLFWGLTETSFGLYGSFALFVLLVVAISEKLKDEKTRRTVSPMDAVSQS